MTELKHMLAEELLNALDDIQNNIPTILDYYVDSNLEPNDALHMDMELLAMNITNLRDSAKLIRDSICINTEFENIANILPTLNSKHPSLVLFSESTQNQEGHKKGDDECEFGVETVALPWDCNTWQTVSPPVKQVAFAIFLHIHMLTDPDSIYNSGIIGNKNLFNTV